MSKSEMNHVMLIVCHTLLYLSDKAHGQGWMISASLLAIMGLVFAGKVVYDNCKDGIVL